MWLKCLYLIADDHQPEGLEDIHQWMHAYYKSQQRDEMALTHIATLSYDIHRYVFF